MPYIGLFTEQTLQSQIEEAVAKLEGHENGLIFHADTTGDVHISLVQKLGDTWSVEGSIALDASKGFHFDREHIAGKVDIIKRW